MYRIKQILICGLFLSLLIPLSVQGAWLWFGPSPLVTIGETDYSGEDFKDWWQQWQEPDIAFPETPDAFIQWFLLFQEAERMQLYQSVEYRKQIHTFLKARSLMLLKAEEVDSKIVITDNILWQQYLKSHAPLYHLDIFFFTTAEAAKRFEEKYGTTENTASPGREDGYFSQRSEWYRPLAINPEWLPIIGDLAAGGTSSVIPWKNDFVILQLKEVVQGSREDFAPLKDQLQGEVWKQAEDRLTSELLSRLRQQYHVQVDSDALQSMETTAGAASATRIIISTDRGNISEEIIAAKIRQLQNFRRKNGFQEQQDQQFRQQVVAGIIDQTLTSWESMARNYQEQEPFATVYRFSCQSRMINLLEAKLFGAGQAVDESAIMEYYQQNIVLFTEPEIIRMVIIEGSQKAMDSLWLDVSLGGDLQSLAQKRTGHQVPVRAVPVNHLNPKVKKVLDGLSDDELSQVFTVNDHVTLVQLIERKAARVIPLAEVQESIRTSLREIQRSTMRQDYLKRLQQKYKITINDAIWQDIKEELK